MYTFRMIFFCGDTPSTTRDLHSGHYGISRRERWGEGGKDPLFWVSIFTCTCPQLILLVGVAANPLTLSVHGQVFSNFLKMKIGKI